MAVPSSAVTAVYVIGQIVMIAGKDILTRAHGALVFDRRVRIIAANLAKEIPIRAEVLDVGTGDGSIAKAIALNRPDIKIEGIDVLIPGPIHTFRFAYLTASIFPSLKKRSTLVSLWTYCIIPAMPKFSCVKQLGSPAVT